jgi:C4-dicarboxylate transporter DctM subunit
MFAATSNFPLLAIPFFILAGKLMEHGGISRRLIHLANVIVGGIKGGLGIVSVIACTFFGSMSGSGAATTAAVGSVLIPSMVKKGYNRDFSTAIHAAAGGTAGIVLPPSVPLILYGVAASVNIGDLFIAGIIPGLFIAMTLAVFVYAVSVVKGYGGGEASGFKDFLRALYDAILPLLMPVIILGGIYGGIFTPTEASVVAVIYGLIVGMFVYREIKPKDLVDIFTSATVITSVIMFIIGAAAVFGSLLARERVPEIITGLMLGFTESWIVALLLINLALLILGTFMETAAAIIILTPILVPIAVAMDINLVHFGIIMIVNLAIGLITPPTGINLFIAANIAGIKFEKIVVAIIPFILIMIVNVLIISFFPAMSLFFLDR